MGKNCIDISAYPDILILMVKDTAQIFKALSDETRLRIMALLVAGGELCVCDIMAALQLPQSTVSRHLSYLRNTGLVNDRRQGIWMYYQVNQQSGQDLSGLFAVLKDMLAGRDRVEEDRQRLVEHLQHKDLQTCR